MWESKEGLQRFDGAFASLRKQLASQEHALSDKICIADVQQLSESVAGIKVQAGSAELAIRAGAERVQQLNDTVVGLVSKFELFRPFLTAAGAGSGGSGNIRMLGEVCASNP